VAKKKRSTADGRAARMGSKSAQDLRQYAEAMRGQIGQLQAMAAQMDKLKIARVELDGVTKLDKGMEMGFEFIDAIELSIRKRKRQLGRADD
jgi:hypothetical protein